jgi:Family of unknown function (DUF6932)
MIPDFQKDGYLPPGVYLAQLDELLVRFGSETEIRKVQGESIRWLIDLARLAGVDRVIINGSFTTDKAEPNDVDCVLLMGEQFPIDVKAEAELLEGLPFLEIKLVNQEGFELLVETIFASDREMQLKGMIEVVL